ncbi:patatin-like phospholipase family protein [Caulobacter sp. LARHSG274]
MADAGANPTFRPADFAAPDRECDLVMKGGITSGVVYPYAILELARRYRFRSIGGASAGAIAAAFAAAAEYARQAGDLEGFTRFERRCAELPTILAGLFQPSDGFKPLMTALRQVAAKDKGPLRFLAALGNFTPSLTVGGAIGLAAYLLAVALVGLPAGLFHGAAWPSWWSLLPGALLAVVVAAAAGLALRLTALIARRLPEQNFGLCSGLSAESAAGEPPALTDWIHQSLQDIAFGPAGRQRPLTFGDLADIGLSPAEIADGHQAIDLRMMTTNLSLSRPHVAPTFDMALLFDPDRWRSLFPAQVMTYLLGETSAGAPVGAPDEDGRHRALPEARDLPVVVCVRMSLSFPILIQAIPLAMRDVGARARGELEAGAAPPIAPLLFSDGGLSSNFPIHFFDTLLPVRPTFALSLDAIAEDRAERVTMPQNASAGSFTPVKPITTLAGFAASLFGAAKDWQDQMLSAMPGQRERVVRIALTPDEGGLNLAMPPAVSRKLMAYGGQAGRTIVADFDFDEHRWRRTLVAYEQMEITLEGLHAIWPGFGAWYDDYAPRVKSYANRVRPADRAEIARRFAALDGRAADIVPPLRHRISFPKPRGRLRISPDV